MASESGYILNHAHRGEWAYRISNMYNKWVRAVRAAYQSGRSPGHVDLQSMKAETRSCAVLHSPTRFSQRVAADSSTNKLRITCTSIPKLTYIVLCSSCLPDLAMCLPFY